MPGASGTRRATATTAALLVLLWSGAGPAQASLTAAAHSNAQNVTAATWSAVATLGSTAPTQGGAMVVDFGVLGPTPQSFSVFNTGGRRLNRVGIRVSQSGTVTVGSAKVEYCSAGWRGLLGACANPGGQPEFTVDTTMGLREFTPPGGLAVGASVTLRISPPTGANVSATVSIEVSSAQVAAETRHA